MDERALELMEILANPQILALGLKYATKLERRRLAEKLMNLAQQISEENDDLGVNVSYHFVCITMYIYLNSFLRS